MPEWVPARSALPHRPYPAIPVISLTIVRDRMPLRQDRHGPDRDHGQQDEAKPDEEATLSGGHGN